jgi:hypothetical protein
MPGLFPPPVPMHRTMKQITTLFQSILVHSVLYQHSGESSCWVSHFLQNMDSLTYYIQNGRDISERQ